jgi:peptide methionine sulfoxide reductase MsrA
MIIKNKKKIAEEYKNLLTKKINGKIETNISEIKNYCRAEEYHQKYILKRGY